MTLSPFATQRYAGAGPRPSPRQQARQAMYSRRLNDAEPAGRIVTCKRCHSERPFWRSIAPDPQGRAERDLDAMEASWRRTHPCTASYVTNQGKQAAA
jgi:hypothetical protein